MAQLNDLVVTGASRFLNEINASDGIKINGNTITADGNGLAVNGGGMVFTSDGLPQETNTSNFVLLAMDSFSHGGQVKWLSAADLKNNFIGVVKNDYANSKAVSANTSTNMTIATYTPGTWITTYTAELNISTNTIFVISITGNQTGTKTVRNSTGAGGGGLCITSIDTYSTNTDVTFTAYSATAATVNWKITKLRLY